MRREIVLVLVVLIAAILMVVFPYLSNNEAEENRTNINETDGNRSTDGNGSSVLNTTGLQYHGYFEVFDQFISQAFEKELEAAPADWSLNTEHIRNAALQSNLIIAPIDVLNPRNYRYDPEYIGACADNGLKIILYVHTMVKYVYFLDPRPVTDQERKELLIESFERYEEQLRRYRDDILAIYVYDEPWVSPDNVTHRMLEDMADAARTVFWGKPVMVMFHRQGNAYRYTHPNGSIITFDDWAGDMPGLFDIIGVDPYFYAYHDDQSPGFRHTGDKGMVDSDVTWACSFGKPVMLTGQAYDPGPALFFERDNTDPSFSIFEGFEDWNQGVPEGFTLIGNDSGPTGLTSLRGQSSLQMNDGNNPSTLLVEFERVHDVGVGLSFATHPSGTASFWITLGDDRVDPIRLGVLGRDLVIHNGAGIELVNRSIDIVPGLWHSIIIRANSDANRWNLWLDGDIQSRMPNAALPTSLSNLEIIRLNGSSSLWVDEIAVGRDWSWIPLNEEETMLYYEVARQHPEVTMLTWWNYHHSFASSLLENRIDFQVADVWATQREIWELIG